MFDRMGEEKAYKIAVLFLVFAIIATAAILVQGVFRTCDEDYNPCSVCMQAGYKCYDPASYMASLADYPQDIIIPNGTWNIT